VNSLHYCSFKDCTVSIIHFNADFIYRCGYIKSKNIEEIRMFHLFTLQGKRIDAQLEHIPKNFRVHHTKINNTVEKFTGGESSESDIKKSEDNKYGVDVYKEAVKQDYELTPVFHASEIMSSPVITIGPDISAKDAWVKFMDNRVHHLPVVSAEGEIKGIVSDRDFLKNLNVYEGKVESTKDAKVKDIMSSDVIAASLLTDIRRIAKAMLDHHIGAMPVIGDEGTITGIITRSDILYTIIHHPELKFWA